MDDSEADKDSGEFISDESFEKNDKGSDDPENDPKFLHQILLKSCKHWKELQKVFFQLCKTIVRTLRPLSKY